MYHVRHHDTEQALTAFLQGVEEDGDPKCAFAIPYTVLFYGSPTLSMEEAVSIFLPLFPSLLALAKGGDSEAMVMVAEAVRYGFTEDEDTPYLYWLYLARARGNKRAGELLHELDEIANPLPPLPQARNAEGSGGIYRDADVADLPLCDAPSRPFDNRVLAANPDPLFLAGLALDEEEATAVKTIYRRYCRNGSWIPEKKIR